MNEKIRRYVHGFRPLDYLVFSVDAVEYTIEISFSCMHIYGHQFGSLYGVSWFVQGDFERCRLL